MAEPERGKKPRQAHLPARERRRRDRRIWRIAFLVSAFAHLLLFLLGPQASIPDSPFSAAGPRALDDEAAAGAMQMLSMSSAPPDAAIPPPTPVPEPEVEPPEEVEIEPEALPEVEVEEPEVPLPGVGDTDGDDEADEGDAGLPEATGQGDGGTTEEGLFRILPASPRGIIFPPRDAPSDVRGVEIEVRVFVDAEGRVVRDSIQFEPRSSDRSFNEDFLERIATWSFRPARQGEEPVASWFVWLAEP